MLENQTEIKTVKNYALWNDQRMVRLLLIFVNLCLAPNDSKDSEVEEPWVGPDEVRAPRPRMSSLVQPTRFPPIRLNDSVDDSVNGTAGATGKNSMPHDCAVAKAIVPAVLPIPVAS